MDIIQKTYASSDAWRGTQDVKALEVPAKTYYHQYLQYKQMTSKDFQGVCLDDLMVLDQLFRLNLYVYDLQEM